MATLETLKFDNLALRKLPLDPVAENYVRSVSGACFSKVLPTPVDNPITVAHSKSALALIDLPETELERKDFAEYFAGNKLLPGSETAAHCYCGHQFGYFSGQLGDGAAIYLGEIVNKKNERWEIQLKGAGKTPYSRQADGRKVLRSSIREFLCSEAMHFLGVPTTRAGSCVTSCSSVIRDIHYDGNPIQEKCTVVLRIAPTFIRFGSFEIFKTLDQFTGRRGPSLGRTDILLTLLNYTIETFFPEIHRMYADDSVAKYKAFFEDVIQRTAYLVAEWQSIGFCHGVLNTDNMSIFGLTIDYGPFGFLDRYDPDHICNASDDGGRYTFIKQPEICLWNLRKLAEALNSALPLSESTPLLDLYYPEMEKCYLQKMRKKLGLIRKEMSEDKELVESFMTTMERTGADFTNSFRCLSSLHLPGLPSYENSMTFLKQNLLEQCYPLESLIAATKSCMRASQFQMFFLLMQSQPELMEQLGKGNMAFQRALAQMEKSENCKKITPEKHKQQNEEHWAEWLLKYKKRLVKEVEDIHDIRMLEQVDKERIIAMNSVNPKFILRNYIAQNAIEKAEAGDFSEVQKVLKLLEDPFSDNFIDSIEKKDSCSLGTKVADDSAGTSSYSCSHVDTLNDFAQLAPDWASDLKVS